jgi:hypothetical protein
LADPARSVSVSLEESKVVIWKTGMSFTSLFNVGVPPRQGGPAPGEPYKTYEFHIGDEGASLSLDGRSTDRRRADPSFPAR